MAIYPGAVFKPTSFGGRTPRNRQGRGILHVGVSRARSLPPWNANTWHLWVALDGYCEQYVDTEFRAYASGDANDDAVQIETAGGTGSSSELNAEPWTPAQAARIADIMRWEASQPGGAPLELLPDSKPGRRGWGPHRLGIQHSRGVGAVPGWLVPGGERWSSAIGKECPGDAKIRQIPHIIQMAAQGDPDMAFGEAERVILNDVLREVMAARRQDITILSGQVAGLQGAVGKLAEAVASDRDDLTADELRAAVNGALEDFGRTAKALEEAAEAAAAKSA